MLIAAIVVRWVNPESPLVDELSWVVALGVPAIAAAFVVGIMRWRLYLSDALQALALRLHTNMSSLDLTAALAQAFGDPSLQSA